MTATYAANDKKGEPTVVFITASLFIFVFGLDAKVKWPNFYVH